MRVEKSRNMETSELFFDSMCRTCMLELVEVHSYDANTSPEQQWQSLTDTIEECASLSISDLLSSTIPQIDVHPSDRLPKKICRKCLEQLQIIYRFQQMCLQSDQHMRESIANGNADLKITITEASVEHKIITKEFSIQFLESREQGVEFGSINNLPEASLPSAADPLQSIEHCTDSQADLSDYVKKEPCDDYVPNVEYSDGETMLSTASLKDEVVTVETYEEQISSAPSTHNCPLCNKSFKKLRNIKNHIRRHKKLDEQGEIPLGAKEKIEYFRFKCDICNRVFHKEESLYKHRLVHEGKVEPRNYTCELCNKKLSSRRSLWNHKRNRHSEKPKKTKKKYICEICNKNYVNSSALKYHLKTHTGERPFLCSECGKSFVSEGYLRQHLLRHGDVAAFDCPHCPKKFTCKTYLAKHILIHEDNKKHVCDICGYGFVKAYQLTTHKRYHNGIKPHKCDYCEMRFVTKEGKRRHMRTHTGEKPYKCKYCDRAFAQSNDHIKHLRTHIGDNVYRCELCPSAYRLASELRVHFATHKNDDEETRERNMKALKEEEAKLQLKLAEK